MSPFHKLPTRSCLFAGAAVSAIAVSLPAFAQDDFAARYAMVDDQLVVTGERVSYSTESSATATKTDTPLIDIPQSISLITRDLIEDQAMRSMADVVRYVPGVSMGQGEGHRDAPTLRGNASTADFFVDGVRDDVQYYRDLYNAERIEILKGPNAMIFGRGGGGGVINRVSKTAEFENRAELTLQGGSFASGRGAVDIGGGVSDRIALRLNAFYENSDSYRDFAGVERFGVNPTALFRLSGDTDIHLSYEYFSDDRDVDRGVPSLNGLPYGGDRTAYFGNPSASFSKVDVNLVNVAVAHAFSDNLTLRNRTVFADYDKYYQNVHARSAVDVNGDVGLQAYFSGTDRQNIFNQTDFIWNVRTGSIAHTIVFGGEFGHQATDNIRAENNNSAGVVNIADPTIFTAPVFMPLRNDNHVKLTVASAYLQDQIDVAHWLQLIGGVRFDRFDLEFEDNLSPTALSRTDEVISPRGGVVIKPVPHASFYASYSKSFLPQSGDQFSSLSASTAALDPEEFENIEIGAKWLIRPELTLTAAAYRLDRKNTRAIDPFTNLTVLTGAQRSKGIELALAGAVTNWWEILAGYTLQEAEITRDTSSAPIGRDIPLTPKHAISVWNAWTMSPHWRASVGVIHQTDQFASISNAVTLPAFTRVDAALYYTFNKRFEAQLNIENLFDETYFGTAHNDNNITPGSPRAFRISLTGRL